MILIPFLFEVNGCTIENINSGKYLFPYPPDPTKFIQCDPVSGGSYTGTPFFWV
jgi:hypothetical protein